MCFLKLIVCILAPYISSLHFPSYFPYSFTSTQHVEIYACFALTKYVGNVMCGKVEIRKKHIKYSYQVKELHVSW